MIRRLLIIDGVVAVGQYRDDGELVAGYGLVDREALDLLTHFVHCHRRSLQSHFDQLALFSRRRGWAPPRGFIFKGQTLGVVGYGNIACLIESQATAIDELLREINELDW